MIRAVVKGSQANSAEGVASREFPGSPNSSTKSPSASNIGTPANPMSWADKVSIALLLVLYTLQGIPMGLCGSIPMILRDRGVSYEALSLFSLVSIPFSLKIVWAPLVDTYYSSSFGRRKTWLVPAQLITGAMMIVGAPYVHGWLREDLVDSSEVAQPDVQSLTLFFLSLYFLMATQDIAVDGWALTMLSRDSVGYASACNAFGQALGIFASNQGLIALSDDVWCRTHLGTSEALVTLPTFMVAWGYIFILTTILVVLGKTEERPISVHKKHDHSGNASTSSSDGNCQAGGAAESESLTETVRTTFALCRLPAVSSFLLTLLTGRVAFAALDGCLSFKLQEYGVSRTTLASVSPWTLGASFIIPAVFGGLATRSPLSVFLLSWRCKLAISCLMWLFWQYTAHMNTTSSTTSTHTSISDTSSFHYLALVVLSLALECVSSLIFLAQMSFFSRVSDPAIGATAMTLLNTVANWGAKWPATLALYLLPKLSSGYCGESLDTSGGAEDAAGGGALFCSALRDARCHALSPSAHCVLTLDGFTTLSLSCLVLGVVWVTAFGPRLLHLQALPLSDWLVNGGGAAPPLSASCTTSTSENDSSNSNTISNSPVGGGSSSERAKHQ